MQLTLEEKTLYIAYVRFDCIYVESVLVGRFVKPQQQNGHCLTSGQDVTLWETFGDISCLFYSHLDF